MARRLFHEYFLQQVLEFFSSLIKCLGNNIEFVVQPSLHDGMDVSISWKLECTKTHAPLGKGFSFIMCHLYQGKVTIREWRFVSGKSKGCTALSVSP
ncbi:uncharacterized protein LOC116027890 [Ipomoea triloba]|uniref:uncharacterized protein LOC116027890 n=1 Tax=Ipomoea triloba TaxID=35885 RepID=UPI00125E26DB|nr:uncharacterized protein LOC116027890 [Ipomoea triloba]